METTQYDIAFLLKRCAGLFVVFTIIMVEVEFKADATATTHDQIRKIIIIS